MHNTKIVPALMPKKKDKLKDQDHWEPVSPGGGSWRQKEYNGKEVYFARIDKTLYPNSLYLMFTNILIYRGDVHGKYTYYGKVYVRGISLFDTLFLGSNEERQSGRYRHPAREKRRYFI